MESADAAERKWACVAVSNLIQNDPSTRRLLQGKNIVGALITRLTDSEEEISNTLAQYLEGSAVTPETAQNIVYNFADNVITTLWCLSETSNKALNAINEINLIPFLMSFLAARDKISLVPVIAAAHCLYVLTDDNYPAISDVRANAGYTSCLLDIVRSSNGEIGKAKDAADPRVVTLKVLSSGDSPSSIQGPNSDHKSQGELELERLEANLRTVQLALEILTGTCATLPDPESHASENILGEADYESEDDLRMDEEDVNMREDGAPSTTATSTSFLPTLVAPLLAHIHPTSLSFPPLAATSPHPPTTSALSAIHISALECLNNVFLSLATKPNPSVSADQDAGRKVWEEIWSALAAVGTETGLGQERRQEMWHVGIGVLWGVGNVWKGTLIPEEEKVRLLIQLCDSTQDESIKVKCVGTLECLAQHSQSIDGNRIISQYLFSMLPLNGLPSPAGTEPLIQAISALIDIYSDENMPYDINFRQGGYLARLASSVDEVKRVVKAIDRRKQGGKDLWRRAADVRDNLVAFIQYRKDLGL
ncbi:hypothetical protein H0H81_012247 [Sphagnurus paluster]|uniref:SYO1-like TPR repeats domain-containing protein n=1 Tax=Sphagnurus paluster TaxID=117069 RepID=A0A9P7FYC7_9AGAR|nr:hypothetical protein H0H81_012247 [Sphagnurus paluster]